MWIFTIISRIYIWLYYRVRAFHRIFICAWNMFLKCFIELTVVLGPIYYVWYPYQWRFVIMFSLKTVKHCPYSKNSFNILFEVVLFKGEVSRWPMRVKTKTITITICLGSWTLKPMQYSKVLQRWYIHSKLSTWTLHNHGKRFFDIGSRFFCHWRGNLQF